MKFKTVVKSLSLALVLVSGIAQVFAAGDNHEAAKQAVQPQVQAAQDQAVANKEAEAVQEALEAVLATKSALAALETGKSKEALAHLEIANGKLSLLLARYPQLGLIPIESEAVVFDYEGDLKVIKQARDEAEDLLDDGKIQDARALLAGLASEIRITTTNLPLALYPKAMQQVAPLVDAGKIKEAKEALVEALNTLVITESGIPIPVLRAEAMLRKVYQQAQSKNPDVDEMLKFLDNAKYQLKVAQALGYGDIKKDYKPLYKTIDTLEDKVKSKKWGEAFLKAVEGFEKTVGELRARIAKPHKTQ